MKWLFILLIAFFSGCHSSNSEGKPVRVVQESLLVLYNPYCCLCKGKLVLSVADGNDMLVIGVDSTWDIPKQKGYFNSLTNRVVGSIQVYSDSMHMLFPCSDVVDANAKVTDEFVFTEGNFEYDLFKTGDTLKCKWSLDGEFKHKFSGKTIHKSTGLQQAIIGVGCPG